MVRGGVVAGRGAFSGAEAPFVFERGSAALKRCPDTKRRPQTLRVVRLGMATGGAFFAEHDRKSRR